MREGIMANFIFPDGCEDSYSSAVLPALPRVGDFVQNYRPRSGKFRVKSVTFEIYDDSENRATILVELEATDAIS
jgi:hypothetical protein